ncbi:MAG TPA: O-antigen ligase family protein [Patescibacteria group bacterium]|nr:O-antigen ligase family protein [Patescibacteria group bacterium]
MRFRLNATRCFAFFWRAGIFLLPWQIRYFFETSTAGGSWEQGRISIYLSSIFLLAAAITAWISSRSKIGPPCLIKKPRLFAAGLILLLIPSFLTWSWRASFEWWLEMMSLSVFLWSLVRMRTPLRSVLVWFIISIIPHAFLGLWQFFSGSVSGTKWLGMASQDPLVRGVSVLEIHGQRILRAYGGFPHPNVFGAWLALGNLAALWLAYKAESLKKMAVWIFFLILFTIALFFTFSRGAELGLFFGMSCFFVISFVRHRCLRIQDLTFLIPCVIFLVGAGFYWPLFSSRVEATGRLEELSLRERQVSVQTGFSRFFQHAVIGTGPRTASLAKTSRVPAFQIVPEPHLVWLLILDEIGFLGMIGLVMIFGSLNARLVFSPGMGAFLAALVLFSFVDHYLWSYWSGLSLTFFAFLPAFLAEAPALTG